MKCQRCTLATCSGLDDSGLLNSQSSAAGVFYQSVQAIEAEAGCALKQGIPFRIREMGLKPEGSKNAANCQAI